MRNFLILGTLILAAAARASSITPNNFYFSFGNLSDNGGGRYVASFEVFGEAINDTTSDFDLVPANVDLPPSVSYDVQVNPLGTQTVGQMSVYSGSLGLFEVSFGPGGWTEASTRRSPLRLLSATELAAASIPPRSRFPESSRPNPFRNRQALARSVWAPSHFYGGGGSKKGRSPTKR